MKLNKNDLKKMVRKEISIVKEGAGWEGEYDEPWEAEMASIAYDTLDPDPAGEFISDAAGDEVVDAVHQMIRMDIEDYVKRGMPEEEATKRAKADAVETLDIAMGMIKERQLKGAAERAFKRGRLESK